MSFDDLLAANAEYRRRFHTTGLPGEAARGLAIVTCIDSRIDPLAMLGLSPGDAKIIRNAGARVTDDVVRSLILATAMLKVTRVCIVQHTDCALAGRSESELRDAVGAAVGGDVQEWQFLAMEDQLVALRSDMERLRACPLLPPGLEVGGFVFDVHTGSLDLVAKSG